MPSTPRLNHKSSVRRKRFHCASIFLANFNSFQNSSSCAFLALSKAAFIETNDTFTAAANIFALKIFKETCCFTSSSKFSTLDKLACEAGTNTLTPLVETITPPLTVFNYISLQNFSDSAASCTFVIPAMASRRFLDRTTVPSTSLTRTTSNSISSPTLTKSSILRWDHRLIHSEAHSRYASMPIST